MPLHCVDGVRAWHVRIVMCLRGVHCRRLPQAVRSCTLHGLGTHPTVMPRRRSNRPLRSGCRYVCPTHSLAVVFVVPLQMLCRASSSPPHLGFIVSMVFAAPDLVISKLLRFYALTNMRIAVGDSVSWGSVCMCVSACRHSARGHFAQV